MPWRSGVLSFIRIRLAVSGWGAFLLPIRFCRRPCVRLLFCHGRELRVECLVRIEYVLLELSSGLPLLWTGADCRALSYACVRLPSWYCSCSFSFCFAERPWWLRNWLIQEYTKRQCDLPDVLASGKIDVRSSLPADITVIRDNGVEGPVEVPNTAASIFKLVPRGLDPLYGDQESLASVERMHSSIWSSKMQIHSLERQISTHPAGFEWVRSEVNRLEVFLDELLRELSFAQTAVIATQSECDKNVLWLTLKRRRDRI